jgi:hypothetical protein
MEKTNNQNPDYLEGLMEEAEFYALRCMKGRGSCPPTLCLDGAEGRAMYHPVGRSSEQAKDEIAAVGRLLGVAHGAEATVMVSHASMKRNGEEVALGLPSKAASGEEEVVLLLGETRRGHVVKMLPVLRGGDGKFLGFGEGTRRENEEVKGRFSDFLTKEVPNQAMRENAKMELSRIKVVQFAGRQEAPKVKEGWRVEVSPKALEQIAERAEAVARGFLQQAAFSPQTLYIYGTEGRFILQRPYPFDQGQEWFAERGKLACIAAGAYACAFVSEAWTVRPKEGKQVDLSRRPSESPDREQVLMIAAESREGNFQKGLIIRRDRAEKFAGYGETLGLQRNDVKDHSQFLTAEVPTKEMREKARMELAAKGLELERLREERLGREEEEDRGRGMGMQM